MAEAKRDQNRVTAIQGVSSIDLETPTPVAVNPATGGVIVDASGLDSRFVNHDATGGGTEELDFIDFDTTYSNEPQEGRLQWNSEDGTLDLGLLGSNVTLQLGQEIHFYGKASGDIANGALVQFAGVQGDHILMKECVVAEIQSNPTYFIGVATQSITNGSFGYVTWFGYVNDVYTDTPDNGDGVDWSVGDILYFSNTTGGLTNTPPTPPDTKIEVAAVIKVQTDASQTGRILVRPTIHEKLSKLSDVDTTGLADGYVLTWDSTNSKWVASAGIPSTTSWGSITGTLSNQTDLQTELDTKVTYFGEYDTDPAVSPVNGDEYWNNLDERIQVYINRWRELNGADRFQFTDDDDFQFTDGSYYQLTS